MKRFLFSMAMSITFITIGFTSLFFELHSYEVVDYQDDTATYSSDTIKVEDIIRSDRINIDLEDSYLYVDFEDDLTDDSVIVIDYSSDVNINVTSKSINLEADHYNSHSYSYRRLRNMLDEFINGLQDGKIYVNLTDSYNHRIIVHCSSKIRDKIQVNYD